jgi:hypothetical protein
MHDSKLLGLVLASAPLLTAVLAGSHTVFAAQPAPATAPEAATPAAEAAGPPAPSVPAPWTKHAQWTTRVYGFVEVDVVHDTTQGMNDLGGWASTAIPKDYTYAGSRDRTQLTARNSRLGLAVGAPEYDGVRAAGLIEVDFMGMPPAETNEARLITMGTLRMRIASVTLESDYVDVLAGQSWTLFGWTPSFLPASSLLLPMPGEIFKRDVQVRISHAFKTDPINVELAVSGNRPPQRDAGVPDVHGGLRVLFNGWKGIRTIGSVGTSLDALSLGVSGAGRRFRISDFEGTTAGTNPDPRFSNQATGYGIAASALVPVIPARSVEEKGNALTLNGEFSTGTGYADLLGGLVSNGGGVSSPDVGYPIVPGSPDKYVPNVPAGLVTYDNSGKLHTIDWQAFIAGAQYHLPPSGKVSLSFNYAQAKSNNVARWADPGQLPYIYTKTRYWDVNLFWDISPVVRAAASYQYLRQEFANGESAHNGRAELSGFFLF